MVKIAVFDSGFGSLSIIRAIQKTTKSEIIYFADQKNFPYGKKTKPQLYAIVKQTMDLLKNKFDPDFIIVGSNTLSLLLDKVFTSNIIGVLPPLREASKISKTKNIAILATKTATKSKELSNYIKKNQLSVKTNVIKVNASPLVELVESGKFITNKKLCKKIIKQTLHNVFFQNNIDVVTLSSTHLPLLKSILQVEFPRITFLDPAQEVANKVKKLTTKKRSKKNSLKIFTSGNTQTFQRQLRKIGIKNKINSLTLS